MYCIILLSTALYTVLSFFFIIIIKILTFRLLWEINFSNGLNAIVERLEDITYEIDLLTEEAKVLDVKRQELEELQMKIDIIKEDQKDSEKIAQE